MNEINELQRIPQQGSLLDALGIPESMTGQAIGVLILCGQGPVQDARTKVKISSLQEKIPGSVEDHEANTWMRMIARAAGELDSTGEVGLLIPSGRATGGEYRRDGQVMAPTEAALMQQILENVYGHKAPQSQEKFSHAQIEREEEAKNTLYNVINAANMIDKMRAANPNDPRLENVWLVGSHFHVPRLKVLAALFGLDPTHVLSAEDVLIQSSILKEKQTWSAGKLDPKGFNKQESLRALIRTRLGQPPREEYSNYFDRKKIRADVLLDKTIEDFLEKQQTPEAERLAKREELKKTLYVEEQKSAHMRMQAERKWVRGLATQIDYVLPLAGTLTSDSRLKGFLLHFSDQDLATYGIDRGKLDHTTDSSLQEVMTSVRQKIDVKRWSWEVVKAEWEQEEYPMDVTARFKELGIADRDIEALSKAEVPPLLSL